MATQVFLGNPTERILSWLKYYFSLNEPDEPDTPGKPDDDPEIRPDTYLLFSSMNCDHEHRARLTEISGSIEYGTNTGVIQCENGEHVQIGEITVISAMPNCACRGIKRYGLALTTNLTDVTLPGVETIDEYGFSGSDVERCAMPDLTFIGDYAFNQCGMLSSIDFPKLETIGKTRLPSI